MFCFAKLCRICLREDRPLISIYCVNEDNVRLCDILASVKPDMNTMNNALPEWICTTCKKQLRRAYKFQKKCSKSLQILIHYLSLLKCGNDENTAQKILSVQMDDILHHNDEEDVEKYGEHFEIKSENSDSYEDNSDSSGDTKDEIFSRKTDNRCDSASFSDFNCDFMCDVNDKFKYEQDSDAESESTVILNLNNVVARVDELNNKEDNLTSELDTNLHSEQSNSVDNFTNSEVCKSSDNNSNVLTNNQSDNSSDIFWSEFTKKVTSCDNAKSSIELDFRSNIHFNTIAFNNTNNSENSIDLLNIKSESNEHSSDTTEEANKNLNTQLTTEDEPSTSAEIKIENEESSALSGEDQPVKPFCNINSTGDSTEEQKFTFELDFTQDDKFNLNTELPADIKTENVSLDDVDGFDNIEDLMAIEKTELFPEQKEDMVPNEIINLDDHMQTSNSQNNVNYSDYANIQDLLTIEKTDLLPLKTEAHTPFTTELTENNINKNNVQHIRVKTTDKINNSIVCQPSIQSSSHSNSILSNLLSNGNLNNSHLSKNSSKFSISNLVNNSTDVREQNKRLLNHATDTLDLKRRKMDLSNNQNTIFNCNQGYAILGNTEIANRTSSAYNGRVYGSANSAEYIDMDEYMRNGLNSVQNITQPPAVFQNHAPNNSYSKQQPSSFNINETNYFVGNTNLAHSLERNHNSYTNMTNIQSTVSNQTLHSTASCNTNNHYNGRSNISPYQILMDPILRKDYTFHIETIPNPQHNPTLHQNTSPQMVPNNLFNAAHCEKRFPISHVEKNLSYNGRQQMLDANKDTNTRLSANNNTSPQNMVPNNVLNTAHYQKQFPIDHVEKNLSYNGGQQMLDANKDSNTRLSANNNTSPQNMVPINVVNTAHCQKQFPIDHVEKNLSYNERQQMLDANKDSNSRLSANPVQTSTTIVPEVQKEFTNEQINRFEQYSDQKDLMDENIDNRPHSRSSQVSVASSNASSNSNTEESTDASENNHFSSVFSNLKAASAYLRTTVEGFVENDDDKLFFAVDVNKSLYTCKKCDEHFPCISELCIHGEIHTEEFDFQTIIYRTRDHTAQSDSIDFVITEDIKLFLCTKCDMDFPDKSLLLVHVKRHVPNMVVTETNSLVCTCQNCAAFSLQSDGTDFKCSKCDKTFPNAENLRIHGFVHFLDRPAKCVTCNRTYKSKDQLRKHNATAHAAKVECPECKKLIPSFKFKYHQETHGTAKMECDVCGKIFNTKFRLRLHKRIHGDKKPFACKHCDKRFLNKMVCDNHERVHTGEKPYKCKECKKCFSQQTSLQVHMRVHTGEKPYKCKDCGKCYTQSYVYKQHLKKHHPPSSP